MRSVPPKRLAGGVAGGAPRDKRSSRGTGAPFDFLMVRRASIPKMPARTIITPKTISADSHRLNCVARAKMPASISANNESDRGERHREKYETSQWGRASSTRRGRTE